LPVKLASPITTFDVDVGIPFVQLAEVAHAVLDVPFQLVVVWANETVAIVINVRTRIASL